MRGVGREHVLRPCRHASAMVSTDPGRNKARLFLIRCARLTALVLRDIGRDDFVPRVKSPTSESSHECAPDFPSRARMIRRSVADDQACPPRRRTADVIMIGPQI